MQARNAPAPIPGAISGGRDASERIGAGSAEAHRCVEQGRVELRQRGADCAQHERDDDDQVSGDQEFE